MFAWLRELQDILQTRREQRNHCNTCEVLQMELERERREKNRLLEKILTPVVDEVRAAPEPMPVMPRYKPWRVKQQELEAADRIQHERILKEFKERTASAEKVMGIENG